MVALHRNLYQMAVIFQATQQLLRFSSLLKCAGTG
jgi:hypothetical protein